MQALLMDKVGRDWMEKINEVQKITPQVLILKLSIFCILTI